MNDYRRKEIDKIIKSLDDLKSSLESIQGNIEAIQNDEQDALSNIPETFQNSERYEKAQSAVDSLDNALSESSSLIDSIDEVIEYLSEASNS